MPTYCHPSPKTRPPATAYPQYGKDFYYRTHPEDLQKFYAMVDEFHNMYDTVTEFDSLSGLAADLVPGACRQGRASLRMHACSYSLTHTYTLAQTHARTQASKHTHTHTHTHNTPPDCVAWPRAWCQVHTGRPTKRHAPPHRTTPHDHMVYLHGRPIHTHHIPYTMWVLVM